MLSACSTYKPETSYKDEFRNYDTDVGQTQGLSKGEIHDAIDRAYLEGQLTSEQARKAHLELSVKGNLTREQMMVVYRDAAVRQENYERKTENLDIVRDTIGTGSTAAWQIITVIQGLKGLDY